MENQRINPIFEIPHCIEPAEVSDATTQDKLACLRIELGACREWARVDQKIYGETGAYAVATMYHVLYLDQAHDLLTELQAWLAERAAGSLLGDTQVAYHLHTNLREMVLALHYARHWAMLSASYHKSETAAASFEGITRAIRYAEETGYNAGRLFFLEPPS